MKNSSIFPGLLFGVTILTFIILPCYTYPASFLTGSEMGDRVIAGHDVFKARIPSILGEHFLAKVSFVVKKFEAIYQSQSGAVATIAPINPEGGARANDATNDTPQEPRQEVRHDWMIENFYTHVLPLELLFGAAFGAVFLFFVKLIYLARHGYLAEIIPWKWLRALHVPRDYWDWLGPSHESIELRRKQANY